MDTNASTFSRRRFAALAAGTLATLVGVRGVSAGRSWCQVDPVVLIDGQLADIFLASNLMMLLSATGPIQLRISIPQGSQGSVVLADLGFGHGYDIEFDESSSLSRTERHTPLSIAAYAPARDSGLPVTVTFAPRTIGSSLHDILIGTSASGNANSWITLQA